MTVNPYQPPSSEVETQVSEERGPRPISAWLLEFLLAVFCLAFLVGVIRSVGFAANNGASLNVVVWFLTVGFGGAMIALCATLVVLIHRGYKIARWLGLVALIGFVLIVLLRKDTMSYASEEERSGAVFARTILIPGLMFWWGYAFGFSKKARLYFVRAWSG